MTRRFRDNSTEKLVENAENLDSVIEALKTAENNLAELIRDNPGFGSFRLSKLKTEEIVVLLEVIQRDLEYEIKEAHTLTSTELELISFG